jgi:WD40 repeat protein
VETQSIKVWREANFRKPLKSIIAVEPKELVLSAFSALMNIIVTVSDSGVVRVWNYERMTLVGCLGNGGVDITAVSIVEPYNLVLTGDVCGFIHAWDVETIYTMDDPIFSIDCEGTPSAITTLFRSKKYDRMGNDEAFVRRLN